MDIAAAKKRCEAATGKQWDTYGAAVMCYNKIAESPYYVIRRSPSHVPPDDPQANADAEFIAHARFDLPAVLEALEEAKGKLEKIRAAHRHDGYTEGRPEGCPTCAILGES